MEEVEKSIEQLITSIKKSSVYTEYMLCEQEVAEEPQLLSSIDHYRARSYYFQESDGDMFDAVDEMDQEFAQIRKNPKVNAYLEAELALCRLLQTVSARITGAVGIRLPDID